VQPGELGPHLHAELGIEIRERLIEEKHLRLADDRPPQRHPLPLAAGEFPGSAGEEVLDRKGCRSVGHAAVDLRPGRAAHLEAERHVFLHREVGVEGVVLKHHRDVAVAGSDVVDEAIADADLAAGHLLEAGHHAERGRLAAPRWTDEHEELAVGDVERDAADGMKALGVALVEVANGDSGHGC